MQIQELAQRAGVSATTIRYYESIHLLPKPKRRVNQSRNYTEADVGRIKLVTGACSLDLSLDDIREIRVHFLSGGARMSPLDQFRAQKDDFFQHDWQSPLEADQRTDFHGLKYYPENPTLRLAVAIEEYPDKETVTMTTSTGSAREYLKYGHFSFEVSGEIATLQVYQDPENGYFFLPFVDATAPAETYGAGRYLDIEPIENGEFLIDFNYAYNPYCAYNDKWSCPIPPKENRLKVRINAGEKKFK